MKISEKYIIFFYKPKSNVPVLVYDAFDDEKICRGQTIYKEKTSLFNRKKEAEKAIINIKSGYWSKHLKDTITLCKVSDLKIISEKAYQNLMNDIESQNLMNDIERSEWESKTPEKTIKEIDIVSEITNNIISHNGSNFGNAEYGWYVGRADGIREAVQYLVDQKQIGYIKK